MALDFTVVITVRQRFGAYPDQVEDVGLETSAPFVGRWKDYAFQCPLVDGSQPAILLFQSQGVNVTQPMTVNGQTIYGGIPPSVAPLTLDGGQQGLITVGLAQWNGNVMLITPNVLQEDNLLHIETSQIGDVGQDSFIIDNLVVIYKTRPNRAGGPALEK